MSLNPQSLHTVLLRVQDDISGPYRGYSVRIFLASGPRYDRHNGCNWRHSVALPSSYGAVAWLGALPGRHSAMPEGEPFLGQGTPGRLHQHTRYKGI